MSLFNTCICWNSASFLIVRIGFENYSCPLDAQRLVEMRQATSTRTKHERGKREKRAAEKEMARLNAQYALSSTLSYFVVQTIIM